MNFKKMSLVKLFEQDVGGIEWRFSAHNGNVLPHHVTLNRLKPYAGMPESLGKMFQITVLGLAMDPTNLKVAGVNVQVPDGILTQTETPLHISVAVCDDGKPFSAGKLQFSGPGYKPLSLTLDAMLANVDSNGAEMRGYAESVQDPKKPNGVAQLILIQKSANALKAAVKPLLEAGPEVIQEIAGEGNDMPQDTPQRKKIFVLVGPPSTGKSRWIKSTFKEPPFIISRDDLVDQVADEHGWTYDDLMTNPPPGTPIGTIDPKFGEVLKAPVEMGWTKLVYADVLDANKEVQFRFGRRVAEAPTKSDNIVIDMTNMNSSSRKNNLRMFKNLQDFEKIAVVFEFQGIEDSILKVAEKRAEKEKLKGKSKTIPASVLQNMFKRFSRPTKNEGYDEIISVDKRALLKALANGDPVSDEMERGANSTGGLVKEEYSVSSERLKVLSGILKKE